MNDGLNPKDAVGLTKAPLRLVPPVGLVQVAKVMAHGAEKYGPYNWRESKVRYSVYIEAALRHLYAAMDGEDNDTEAGAPHLASVAACMLILLDAVSLGSFVDDRPAVRGKTGQELRLCRSVPVAPRAPRTVAEIVRQNEGPMPPDFPYTRPSTESPKVWVDGVYRPLTVEEVRDIFGGESYA